MINPIDRIPGAVKEFVLDFIYSVYPRVLWILIAGIIVGAAILGFANTRDFYYPCDTYELGELPICHPR